jgi:hypothetical protein
MLNFREPIYAAFFKLLSNPANLKYPFSTKSRRFVKWGQDKNAMLPALYILEGPTDLVTQLMQGGMYGAQKYTLKAQVWAYAQANPSDNPANIPSQQMHAMKDAIETAIQSPDGDLQRLITPQFPEGLVENCFVEGEGYCDPGIADPGLIVVMVPVVFITGLRGFTGNYPAI